MLGRNRITKIEGLSNLQCIDILDLHSNGISELENLRSLVSLRVLNVEDNLIREVPSLHGLSNLVEINLRRNKVWVVHDNHHCRKLQKVVLTNNQVATLQDVEALFSLESLSELWLDQNKVASQPMFKTITVSKCQSLKMLNGRRILDEVKRSALKHTRKEESKKKDLERKADYQQEKLKYIELIQSDWNKQEDEISKANNSNSKYEHLDETSPNPHTAYVELDGTLLNIYGNGSAAINRTESHVATCIKFEYVPVNQIGLYCEAMSQFSHLTHLVLSSNHLCRPKQVPSFFILLRI